MEFIATIKNFISSWETKNFYLYIGLFVGFFVLVTLGLIVYSQYEIHDLQHQIENVNELREQMRPILGQARDVEQQRKDVDAMLAQDKNFKIGQYFEELLEKLSISDKNQNQTISHSDQEDNYREEKLTARLVDMNMQKLTELLQDIENKPRIYSKDLDITKSLKKQDTIDVSITIATLQPKAEKAALVE